MYQVQRKSRCFYVMIVVLMVIVPPNHCQRISSSITSGQPLCPGDEVVLTCETRSSFSITWRNTDYIGGISNQLRLIDGDNPGRTRNSPVYGTTVAKLTRNFLDNGIRVLESELRITIRADVASTVVSCVHDNGDSESFTLRLLDTPGMVDIVSDQKESLMGGCVVHCSWSPPNNTNLGDIGNFTVVFNQSSNRFAKTGSSVYMLVQPVCTCSSHNITIFAVDRCGRNGQPRNHVVSDMPNFDASCEDHFTTDRTDQPITDTAMSQNDGSTIGLIVVTVALAVALLGLIATLIVITLMCCGIITPCLGEEKGKSSNVDLRSKPSSNPTSDDEKIQETT